MSEYRLIVRPNAASDIADGRDCDESQREGLGRNPEHDAESMIELWTHFD